MYFVLGLLTAGLVALALSPAVWRRAHRLAKARVEGSLPMSLGEVQAEKDQLRASFALSARRLELQVADLRKTASEQILAAGRYKAEITTLTAQIEAGKAAIAALEARLVAAGDALKAAEARIEAARAEVASRDATLGERAQRIAGLEARLAAAQLLTEEQRLELIARDTAIGNLHDQLDASRTLEAQIAAARDEVATALEVEKAAFAAERLRGQGLEARIAAFGVERTDRMAALERRSAEISAMEAELAGARTEREALTATVAALEAERAGRLAEIARRTEEIARLREGALTEDGGTPVAANDAGDNMRKAIESIEAEKSSLEARLAALEADHAVVLTENADLRRTAANGSETQAADEQIRERLAEIAAHVLRLTQEQPVTPASDAAPPVQRADKGNGGHRLHAVTPGGEAAPAPAGEPPKPDQGRSLAERIRALQQAARH
jgi:chromosome segregation ATPase